jgi:hypothetical protein
MKIKILSTFHSKSKISEENDIYSLDIQIIEGKSVLPGQTYVCDTNQSLLFIVKSIVLGGVNYEKKSFPITIEKTDFPIKDYENKSFSLKKK